MKIQKILLLLILATIVSCNKTIKKDESITFDKKSTVKNHSKITLTINNEKICDYYFDESQKLVKFHECSSNGELNKGKQCYD